MKAKNKNTVRLTESMLTRIVAESVKKALRENEESSNPVMSAPVIAAFENWMGRNNIECGYFDYSWDDEYQRTIRLGKYSIEVPKLEVQVPSEDMLVFVVDRYYPSEYDYTNEGLIQWFDNDAPEVDVEEFMERMDALAEERYGQELSDWRDDARLGYEEWLDGQAEDRNQRMR